MSEGSCRQKSFLRDFAFLSCSIVYGGLGRWRDRVGTYWRVWTHWRTWGGGTLSATQVLVSQENSGLLFIISSIFTRPLYGSNENLLDHRTNSLAFQRLQCYKECAIIELQHLEFEASKYSKKAKWTLSKRDKNGSEKPRYDWVLWYSSTLEYRSHIGQRRRHLFR